MLANAFVYASLPTTDLARSRGFYEGTLGLAVEAEGPDYLTYRAGGDTRLFVYSRPPSRAEHTVANFVAGDFDRAIAGLRERGVALQEYDMPDLQTEGGVLTTPEGRLAWFEDPDGNILGLFERSVLGGAAG
jgi:catechol 2,3-dioxygenase-like lactoylglutathione lyase family enzyme